jgi:hypothetical protein
VEFKCENSSYLFIAGKISIKFTWMEFKCENPSYLNITGTKLIILKFKA